MRNRRCSVRSELVVGNGFPVLRVGNAGATTASVPLALARHAFARRAVVGAAHACDHGSPKFAARLVLTCFRPRTTPTPNPSPHGGGEHTESVARADHMCINFQDVTRASR